MFSCQLISAVIVWRPGSWGGRTSLHRWTDWNSSTWKHQAAWFQVIVQESTHADTHQECFVAEEIQSKPEQGGWCWHRLLLTRTWCHRVIMSKLTYHAGQVRTLKHSETVRRGTSRRCLLTGSSAPAEPASPAVLTSTWTSGKTKSVQRLKLLQLRFDH